MPHFWTNPFLFWFCLVESLRPDPCHDPVWLLDWLIDSFYQLLAIHISTFVPFDWVMVHRPQCIFGLCFQLNSGNTNGKPFSLDGLWCIYWFCFSCPYYFPDRLTRWTRWTRWTSEFHLCETSDVVAIAHVESLRHPSLPASVAEETTYSGRLFSEGSKIFDQTIYPLVI